MSLNLRVLSASPTLGVARTEKEKEREAAGSSAVFQPFLGLAQTRTSVALCNIPPFAWPCANNLFSL